MSAKDMSVKGKRTAMPFMLFIIGMQMEKEQFDEMCQITDFVVGEKLASINLEVEVFETETEITSINFLNSGVLVPTKDAEMILSAIAQYRRINTGDNPVEAREQLDKILQLVQMMSMLEEMGFVNRTGEGVPFGDIMNEEEDEESGENGKFRQNEKITMATTFARKH